MACHRQIAIAAAGALVNSGEGPSACCCLPACCCSCGLGVNGIGQQKAVLEGLAHFLSPVKAHSLYSLRVLGVLLFDCRLTQLAGTAPAPHM